MTPAALSKAIVIRSSDQRPSATWEPVPSRERMAPCASGGSGAKEPSCAARTSAGQRHRALGFSRGAARHAITVGARRGRRDDAARGKYVEDMPFALHEYDAAYGQFFSEALQRLAQARSPILSQIRRMAMAGPLGSRIRTHDGVDVMLDEQEAGAELTIDLGAIRTGHFDSLYSQLDKASDEMARSLVGGLVQNLDAITAGTGNQVNAGGQPLSFEVFYAALEKIEFSLDENDDLVMPSLFVHPDTARKLQELPDATPEQEAQLSALFNQRGGACSTTPSPPFLTACLSGPLTSR